MADKKKNFSTLLAATALFFAAAAATGADKPKYGPAVNPRATPIVFSHDYFRSHPAPDFWALTGYYVPQFNDAACSAASVTMVLNAARAKLPKTAADKLITQQALLDKVTAEKWKQRLSPEGVDGDHGATLDMLARVTEAAFKAYGFPDVRITTVHVADTSPKTKQALMRALKQNEKSARDFILANFNQQAFTDDTDAGHIAPVAAYDAAKERVLVFDPDREWYEPYWVSVDTFLAGMATRDKSSGLNRGYLVVEVGAVK